MNTSEIMWGSYEPVEANGRIVGWNWLGTSGNGDKLTLFIPIAEAVIDIETSDGTVLVKNRKCGSSMLSDQEIRERAAAIFIETL